MLGLKSLYNMLRELCNKLLHIKRINFLQFNWQQEKDTKKKLKLQEFK